MKRTSFGVFLLVIMLLLPFALLTVNGADMSGGYQPITLNVPYYPQRNAGDCGIASISMIEAYKKGYSANDSTVYNAVYSYNNNSVWLSSYGNLGYGTISNSLSEIYAQLQKNNPVIVYRLGSQHYSVIYGYNGSTTTLEKKGFLVLNTNRANQSPYTNLEAWLSGNTWEHTLVRTHSAVPLSDKTAGNGMFREVWASNISYTNARINATIPYQQITGAGFYIGKTTSSMTKVAEHKMGSSAMAENISFDLNEYYGSLSKNTTYYYKIYVVINGVTYTSNPYSFYTGYQPSSSTSSVSVSYSSYPAKHSIGTTNATLAGIANLTNATNYDVDKAGIYLYDYKGSQLATKTEDTTNVSSFNGEPCVEMWYNVNTSLGYTLAPGTTYKYKLFVEINGTKYYSSLMSFTTSGAHSHKWNSGSVTTAATCAKAGVKTYTCTTCGGTKTETVAATGNHTAGSWTTTKAPTCTTTGTKVQKCSVCSTTLKTETVAATGHSWNSGKITTAATCVKAGVKTYTCTTCGGTKTEAVAATGNHTAGSWTTTKAPTCTATGTKVQKCSVCGTTLKIETVAATGHNWNSGKITTAATCVKAGVKTYTCSTCGGTKTETIAATGVHTFSAWTKTNDTTHQRSCTVCGKKESASHNWNSGVLTVAPSEFQDGLTTYTCLGCGAQKTAVVPSTHSHAYGQNWISDETGHWHTCSCGDKRNESAHTPGAEATETSAQVCTVCGYIITSVLEHAHSFGDEWKFNDAEHWHECACGVFSDPIAHEWDEGTVVSEPSYEKEGELLYTCTVCAATKAEALPVLTTEDTSPQGSESTSEGTSDALITTSPSVSSENPDGSTDSGALITTTPAETSDASTGPNKNESSFPWEMVLVVVLSLNVVLLAIIVIKKVFIKK